MKYLRKLYIFTENNTSAHIFRIIRYLISGGTAALVNWSTLFLLVHTFSAHYLQASIFAFTVSILVSFIMQKFWTFQDNQTHDIYAQTSRYLLIIFTSLLLNTVIVYILVDRIGTWYMAAQIIATVIIAITNFFFYKHFVFRERLSVHE